MVRRSKPAAHGSVGVLPLKPDTDVGLGRFPEVQVPRISLGYLKAFGFLGCIKFALLVNRVNPVLAGWLADRVGITAAYRRGRQMLAELPRTGNGS
jgi:hypothetical protein